MLFREAQLLAAEIVVSLNRAVLSHQQVVGILAETLEIGYHKRGKRQANLFFELERFTEEGLGYTSLEGDIHLSKTTTADDWRTGGTNGTLQEVGGDGKVSSTGFTFEGKHQPGKGLVVYIFHKDDKTKPIAEFTV